MKPITGLVFLLAATATTGWASSIARITLAELQARASIVVMAQVTKVEAAGNADQVTIQVDSYLKGAGPQTVYTFTLVTRGGLKDFDPALKPGDTGVFFLKQVKPEGQVEKAYWGGVAVFPKNHFDLTTADQATQPPAGAGGQPAPPSGDRLRMPAADE